jgi:hypothetical protein
MKPYRRFLWILSLLAPLFWMAWPSGDNKAEQAVATPPGLGSKKQIPSNGSRVKDDEGASRDRAGQLSRRLSDRPEPGDPAGVDRILANDGISHEQAALQLRKLALDPTRSTADRLEALQHGLNLGIESFAGFAEQADLPAELASHYLSEIINHNDSPATQIRAYIALMGHPDEEVSALAEEMIAIQVGDELQEASREKLLRIAQKELAELAAEGGK